MSAKVIPLQQPRQSMALIAVMSGKLDGAGELNELTQKKLERAIALSHEFRRRNPPRPYAYVFPDCSREDGQRVCDVLRTEALAHDPFCRTAEVPPRDAEYVTDAERLTFLNTVKAKVAGDCIMLV